jgi:hypothetical protein
MVIIEPAADGGLVRMPVTAANLPRQRLVPVRGIGRRRLPKRSSGVADIKSE